ncbi:hypothetical protein XENTR_v10007304 [Xenopus tropicalis]|nr:hypothetical protein XENTR_v10007304 [Xenopus tropicalis]
MVRELAKLPSTMIPEHTLAALILPAVAWHAGYLWSQSGSPTWRRYSGYIVFHLGFLGALTLLLDLVFTWDLKLSGPAKLSTFAPSDLWERQFFWFFWIYIVLHRPLQQNPQQRCRLVIGLRLLLYNCHVLQQDMWPVD